MFSRTFVRRKVMEQRADLSIEQVDRLIDDAVRMLGNLVHWRHGSHEDDDVVTAVLFIGQDIQEHTRAL